MLIKICQNCGKVFHVIDSRVAAKYCSKKCGGEALSKSREDVRECRYCHKPFKVYRASKLKFCSTQCAHAARVTSVEKTCEVCGKKFFVIKTREETAHYCSKGCASKARQAEKETLCTWCGKPIHRKPYKQKLVKHGSFCCKDCESAWKQEAYSGKGNHQYGLRGPLNASYKEGKVYRKNGRLLDTFVYMPSHPKATKAGRVREYVVIVEQNYQKFDPKYFYFDGENHYLKKGVVVHHIDCNHLNNTLDNLMPLTISEHSKIHSATRIYHKDNRGKFISKTAVLKQGGLLETPEVDNQQPSLTRNSFEGSTTNDRVLTSNVEDSNVDTSTLPEQSVKI